MGSDGDGSHPLWRARTGESFPCSEKRGLPPRQDLDLPGGSMKPFHIPRCKPITHCCADACGHGTGGGHTQPFASGASRREFLLGAAGAAAALAALAGLERTGSAQGRNMPAPPPLLSPIEGLIDFHTHASPDIFARSLDDEQLTSLYRERAMEGVVLKNHVVPTADRAFIAHRRIPGIKVFGGVTLNGAVGGINPEAAAFMRAMEGRLGRIVWLPTFDADNHVKYFKEAPAGIKVVGPDGKALPAVHEVLKLCAKEKLVLCTGHSSAAEVLTIVEAARDAGCDRIVVTHAQFAVVNLSEEQMKQAAKMGAKLEICAMGLLQGEKAILGSQKSWRYVSLQETADRIKSVGAEHFVLGTDLGQSGHPTPADGLAAFVTGLMAQGITKEQIRTLGREVPGTLLMG
jgi:uncharacterized protein DUF6282